MDQKGELKNREVFGPSSLGKGAWPDGIAFDTYGNLWGTMVYSDKLFVLTPEGDLRILLETVRVVLLGKKFERAGAAEEEAAASHGEREAGYGRQAGGDQAA